MRGLKLEDKLGRMVRGMEREAIALRGTDGPQ